MPAKRTARPVTKIDEAPATDEQTVTLSDLLDAESRIVYGKVLGPLTDKLIERMTTLAVPYSKLSEWQQRDFIQSIKHVVRTNLMVAIDVIASAETVSLDAELIDLSMKGTTIKAKIETVKDDDNVLALSHALGSMVRVVFPDAKLLDDGSHKGVEPEPDQPALLAEDDLVDQAQHPEDDSDLAGVEQEEDA